MTSAAPHPAAGTTVRTLGPKRIPVLSTSVMAAAALLARACGPIRGGECAPTPHSGAAVRRWLHSGVPTAGSSLPQASGAPSGSTRDLCPSWVAPGACAAAACSDPGSCSHPANPLLSSQGCSHSRPTSPISPPVEIWGVPFLRSQAWN